MKVTNKYVFERIKLYLLLFSLLTLFSLLFLFVEGKRESFLLLNNFHAIGLDVFFKYYTNAGDGIFAIALCLILLCFKKWRFESVVLLISYAASGLIAQLLKRLIESPRPKSYFNNDGLLHLVDGITLMGSNSFPSGHTTTAFAVATVLAIFTDNIFLQIVFLLLAILVGFSRIYLSQHFPEDVIAGAIIGVITSILCYKILANASIQDKFRK